MILLFHDIGFPPLWICGVILLLSLASDFLIFYGVVFLALVWKKRDTGLKMVAGLVPLVFLVAGSVFGDMATAPFGLLAAIPALLVVSPLGSRYFPDSLWFQAAEIGIGCLLNALGLLGIVGLVAKRWNLLDFWE